MIREIMHDTWFLSQKSEKATKEDAQIAQDLLDTLKANEEGCVGMAANMIGVNIMYNPVFVKKTGKYQTEEGCLSLIGVRKCTRYEEIEVEYEDINFKKQRGKFQGWTAQIIQHECDHLEGILI